MYCKNCGKKLKENANFCESCGNETENTEGQIHCRHCDKLISEYAKVCPYCRKRQRSIGKIILTIILIWLILYIVGCITMLMNEDYNTESFTYTVTKSSPDEYNVGYYIEGIVENQNKKDYSYVQIEFVCYDKDGNNMGGAFANTNNLRGNETWKFKAMGLFDNVEKIDHCDYVDITGW